MVKVSRRRRDLDETLTAQPPYALVGVVRVPGGWLLRVDAPEADALEAHDRLLYVRNTGK